MHFTVGGEEYELTREAVIRAMDGAANEPIRKHVVEIDDRVFPPKQVFATVTGRARTSFTTMEAQRILRRLGFVCRQVALDGGTSPTKLEVDETDPRLERPSQAETRLATLEAAVAGLHARVSDLEAVRS